MKKLDSLDDDHELIAGAYIYRDRETKELFYRTDIDNIVKNKFGSVDDLKKAFKENKKETVLKFSDDEKVAIAVMGEVRQLFEIHNEECLNGDLIQSVNIYKDENDNINLKLTSGFTIDPDMTDEEIKALPPHKIFILRLLAEIHGLIESYGGIKVRG